MPQAHRNTVLLLLADATAAGRWADALGQEGFQVRHDWPPRPTEPPTLVVTDRPDPMPWGEETGVIRIAAQAPADVVLPAGATTREIALACRLLAKLVKLRRQQRQFAKTQKLLAEQAATDPVTGLPNRRAWDRRLAHRVAMAQQTGRRLCLAILDLDFFKPINDNLGHAAGDRLLRTVGRVLVENLRADDFVARLGGDEFGLLLWVPDPDTAVTVVERVRRLLPERLAGAQQPVVTASAGLAVSGEMALTSCPSRADRLFHQADAALLRAKRLGRDRTVLAPAD